MNDEKLAWILTVSSIGLAIVVMLTAAAYAPAAPGANTSDAAERTATSAYASMFQERNRLQARINFCERQQEGDTPAYRRSCEDDEMAKLDEYRKRISEIDRELKKLRESTAR